MLLLCEWFSSYRATYLFPFHFTPFCIYMPTKTRYEWSKFEVITLIRMFSG
jgi:hypothetical protein